MFLAAIMILRFAGGLDLDWLARKHFVAQAKGLTLIWVTQNKKPSGKNIYSLKNLDAKCSKGTMDVLNDFRLVGFYNVMGIIVKCARGFESNALIADCDQLCPTMVDHCQPWLKVVEG